MKSEAGRQKFIRYIFHELRVPFNCISMTIDLLVGQEMHLLGNDSKDMVNMAACACLSMKSIMNDTLDFYKMESGFFMIANAPNSLTNLLESTIYSMTPLAKEKGTDVKLTLVKIEDSCSSLCLFDFGRFQQVLANLISNAIKFSPHDGTGEVSVSMEIFDDSISIPDVYWQAENTDEVRDESIQSQPSPLLRRSFSSFSDIELEYLLGVDYKISNIDDFSDDISVLIRVKDNGDGISQKDIEESLFRDFRQLDAGLLSKHKGSGLGLAICLKIFFVQVD
jgi:signal transduction histidine kinase